MTSFVTRALGEFVESNVDLNDLAGDDGLLFVRDGVGFAGIGRHKTGALHEMARYLATCDHHTSPTDSPGTPIAIGWHSFDGSSGEAIIPQICVGKSIDGSAWVTFPSELEQHVVDMLREALSDSRPDQNTTTIDATEYRIRPGVDPDAYLACVRIVRDAVRRGDLVKAVVARDLIVSSSTAISVHALLKRLKASFGSSYRYSINGLVGASPELLIERRGDVVRSLPLAGTCPRTGDTDTDARLARELRESTKNQIEHRVVIDMVHDTLLPWCSYLDWQPEPDVIPVANVQHLGTRIEGTLSNPAPHVLDMMTALSPTPALGGFPRNAALELLSRHEGLDRGRYGGAVGWFSADGDGTWAVTIRCAELSPDRHSARLFAGGGIVAESDPASEYAETQAKFQAMLAAIVRP